MNKINDFLRIKEAAAYLGVTMNTLRNWERQKKIKVYRCSLNNYRLYKKEDLDQVLEQTENNCTTNPIYGHMACSPEPLSDKDRFPITKIIVIKDK